ERAEKFAFTLSGAWLTFWNRRMRTRMYGGVRGRGLTAPSYSINRRIFKFTLINVLYRQSDRYKQYGSLELGQLDYLRGNT
ncbi:hypothetical protein, partial [Paenibacillus rhizophilus]|uniref:hypothetical protein n=1 Tax=Paenibacillus rhizophilus TaxID=1850366 RepID=UPI001C8AA96C